jgi:glycosidase
MALAHDYLYPNPDVLVPFLDLHDVPCFMSLPGAVPEAYKLALTFLLTVRGTPMLYYGDEIGLPGAGDPTNRRHFPGGFPGDARDAFTAAGRTPPEQAIFDHVRRLTRLRREIAPLRRGRMVDLLVAEQQYAYARILPGGDAALVALNNDDKPATLNIPVAVTGWKDGARLTDRLNGTSTGFTVSGGLVQVALPPKTARLLTPR